MKIIRNAGTDRVVDLIRPHLRPGHHIDAAIPDFSLFAFEALHRELSVLGTARLLLPREDRPVQLLGTEADRAARNRLQARWLARRCLEWLESKAKVRRAKGHIPQGALVLRDPMAQPLEVVTGALAFTTDGLGITPGNPMSLIQVSETPGDRERYATWLDFQWNEHAREDAADSHLRAQLAQLAAHQPPSLVYARILQALFADRGDTLDEDQVIKPATGIRDSEVWKRLYKFQRDGVVGAIDKLNRYGGCIIADSVGLGKTFEALAVIKYHELRNFRVLVLCPKRLRDNWTLWRQNDRRNVLAKDRFAYDVLNHTDLSRDEGLSGDIDLQHVNWGNYDLVVIDESHNFRNKLSAREGGQTRYERLMQKVIREGVKTRVLMLSATPVNNRLADLKNQIAFVTEGDDEALEPHGIASIENTTRLAQRQFNKWLDLDDVERTPGRLVEMLGFDYFALLDLLTIARSRKHIERYYGTSETGRFPERLRPINVKADVDLAAKFPPIREINDEIRRLNLASYSPLKYVLPHMQNAYEARYRHTVRGGQAFFRQQDREQSLVNLLRVNVLKRMESSVVSFALTVERQLEAVNMILQRIEEHAPESEALDIREVDFDDPEFEGLIAGQKVKVLLKDVDVIRWKQDLTEDRNRLMTLLSAAKDVSPERDAKLHALRQMIARKHAQPINGQNRKVLVFTAFADTARYLYEQLAPWAKATLGVESALVTGTGTNRSTLPSVGKSLGGILTAFSPQSRERSEDDAVEGEIDLVIATDCISEGQNLQDCDWLVNYDIHWNPVRIIQRFGRIDRLGSPNTRIQLANFWPNMELEQYIALEQRVSGRMVLLDISATGEENIIDSSCEAKGMNDLEYRRKQLLRLQDAVIDLEDLSTGVSITDLTLTDFRIDLAELSRTHDEALPSLPLGAHAVTVTADAEVPPGVVFLLRAEGKELEMLTEDAYPLAPHYLVHVGDDGTVLLSYAQAKRILDRLKRTCVGKDLPDAVACAKWDRKTKDGSDMRQAQKLLTAAVSSIVGKSEERAVESLFRPGRIRSRQGDFAGIEDFEVIAFVALLPGQTP